MFSSLKNTFKYLKWPPIKLNKTNRLFIAPASQRIYEYIFIFSLAEFHFI